MPAVTRILSDLHYGDRASQVKSLPALRPLLEGIGQLILNGDTLDTRPGPTPPVTAALAEEVGRFFATHAPRAVSVTGNHDPEVSATHSLELAGGKVFVTHGDVLFDNLVPWGKDARLLREKVREQLALIDATALPPLERRLRAFRRAAALIPQRHQSERHGLKYAFRFATDTVWPPTRFLRVLQAWRRTPALAAELLHRHRPGADFIILGHTHLPGVWRLAGKTVINTGSFCRPLGGFAVDLADDCLRVRRIRKQAGEFHPGATIAEFALAAR